MEVITELSTPTLNKRVLTIGNFDGMHLGHQHLLKQAHMLAEEEGETIVYTFINHPTHVLSNLPPIPHIYTLEHKLRILEENDVDYTILTTFTKELAGTPFDAFLQDLKNRFRFTHLVLGEGARFGKDKQGDEVHVRKCAAELGFHVSYVSKLRMDDTPLSSGHIRTLIAAAEFEKTAHCLGRPYSIYAPLLFERTRFMQLHQHCLPPTGTYSIYLVLDGKNYAGKAHIERHEERIRIELDDGPVLPVTECAELIFKISFDTQ